MFNSKGFFTYNVIVFFYSVKQIIHIKNCTNKGKFFFACFFLSIFFWTRIGVFQTETVDLEGKLKGQIQIQKANAKGKGKLKGQT